MFDIVITDEILTNDELTIVMVMRADDGLAHAAEHLRELVESGEIVRVVVV